MSWRIFGLFPYAAESFLKTFLAHKAMIRDAVPENKTTAYSNPLEI